MAFSKRQYENFIRTIIVASVAKEFRRAKIIDGVIKRAKNDKKVATGGLIRPDVTGSIIPSRDDRWLLNKDSVIVNVGTLKNGLPTKIQVTLNIEYGTDGDYVFTRKDLNAKWPKGKMPNVNRIKFWLRAKTSRGLLNFKYRGVPLDPSNEVHLDRAAYVVARSIARKGIKEEYKSNYFKDVGKKVKKTVDLGVSKASGRIIEKYQEELYDSIVQVIDVNII